MPQGTVKWFSAPRGYGFIAPDGGDIAFLVNHHPSKYGGAASGPRRQRAVLRLKQLADSLQSIGATSPPLKWTASKSCAKAAA